MAPTAEPVKKLSHFTEADKLLKECDAIEAELVALSHLYEQYFVGVDRAAPLRRHQQLRARLSNLKSTFNRTTSFQFRVQNLAARFLAFEQMWRRTVQEIENGSYARDLFKARRRGRVQQSKQPEANPPKAAPAAIDEPGEPSQAERQPATARAVSFNELSDAKLRVVYEAYVSAKKRCSEDVSKLSFESMAAKLRKQIPLLVEKHKARSVEFKIVIKDGKAVLQAIPKD
jgi:hypothetical protein